ncbi:hypothetical protein FRC19_007976 [Serendipita sp. 401]|nr:hypothetical protein FRC19_007976 [Serendipita sp. 401]
MGEIYACGIYVLSYFSHRGVGYGICQRLLINLCEDTAEDSLPQSLATPGDRIPCEFTASKGLTLIMACRSAERAVTAKENLLKHLDEHISKQKNNQSASINRMLEFRRNLKVDLLSLDLANTTKTFEFCEEVTHRYPYVSHAIFNAGYAPWIGINWPRAVLAVITDYMEAVTNGETFRTQKVGITSKEGYGMTFQSNVLGHFILARHLRPLMVKSPWPARVIWTSSLVSGHALDRIDWDDLQLLKTANSYGASKYQIQLITHYLDMESATSGTNKTPIRHLISHPGVTSTSIFLDYLNFVTAFLMNLAFYVARLFGSQDHPISWINGAIAATHLALVPSQLLNRPEEPVLYGSRATRFGKPYVGRSEIYRYSENADNAQLLVGRCDALYNELKRKRRGKSNGA